MKKKFYFEFAHRGEFVRMWRTHKGITQTQLGAMMGIAQPNIAAWENGTRGMPDMRARAIANHLNMTEQATEFLLGLPHKKNG